MSVTAKVAPGAATGADGLVPMPVGTRLAVSGWTCTIVLATISPPFSDHARTKNVLGPAVSARKK